MAQSQFMASFIIIPSCLSKIWPGYKNYVLVIVTLIIKKQLCEQHSVHVMIVCGKFHFRPIMHVNSYGLKKNVLKPATSLYCGSEQCRSRSAGTFVLSDQDLHYSISLLLLLGESWPRSQQRCSRSHGTDVPVNLHLHCSPMWKSTDKW
jgi:hypothetical protein